MGPQLSPASAPAPDRWRPWSAAALWAALALGTAACESAPEPVAAEGLPLSVGAGEVAVAAPASATIVLRPRVEIAGLWRAPDACVLERALLRCSFGATGSLEVALDPTLGTVRPRLRAAEPVDLGGFELAGALDLGAATAWLSNGFQSWSAAGAIALGPLAPEADQAAAAAEAGDAEVFRTGEAQSHWHTWVAGGERALVAGALAAERLRSWVAVGRDGASVRLRLVQGGVPADRVAVAAGEVFEGEPWWIRVGPDLHALLRAYGDALPSRRDAHPVGAEVGWNSWYELWDDVDAEAVRTNAAIARATLGPSAAGATQRVVIDDGWQRAWGDWRPNAKFPGGLGALAAELRADGFEVGVWLAPLLAAPDAPVALAHPDWWVEGASYNHGLHGPLRVLDVTHPDARAHLHDVIAGLVAEGITLLKIDFLFAGTFAGRRATPMSATAAYRLALATIREAAGEDTILLAVGAPSVPSLPFADAWRLGGDIALEPFGARWAWLPSQARSLAARWPLCRAVLCDADPPLLRDLARPEVELGAAVVALAGGGLFLSDDLRVLDAERRGWLPAWTVAAAVRGAAAEPQDLVPAAPPPALVGALEDFALGATQHVVPGVWHLPDGGVVRLNVDDAPRVLGGVEVPAHGVLGPD